MRILITAPYNAECKIELEEVFGRVMHFSWKDRGKAYNEKELVQLIKENNAQALITELDDVTDYVMEQVPNLKFIGVCRANPVNVDIQAANRRNIPVFHTPARNAQAVAELLIGNLITFLRNVVPSIQWTKGNNWTEASIRPYLKFRGNELAGKTVGFVGFGAVGQKVANILRHFPCPIQYYDPFVNGLDPNFKSLSLREIFETSDIVSIHLPVNDSTKGIISADLLQLMKQDAVFINTARSAVVDYEALFAILKSNKIRGAILDVFDNEPPLAKDYELIHFENVLATPHIAGASFEVEDHHAFIMNESLKQWFLHKQTKNIFNQKQLFQNN